MRIIAGTWRGRRIVAPSDVRPTGDRVREALFSILGGTLDGTFVDLYAGSGAVGLEARSRGAAAILVEREPASLDAIRANMELLDVHGGVTVLPADALRLLKAPEAVARNPLHSGATASVVFADPSYEYHARRKLLRLLGECPFVSAETVIVLERSARTDLARDLRDARLAITREVTHGETTLTFMHAKRGAEGSAPE